MKPETLTIIRVISGLTQTELGQLLGYSLGHVQSLEKGKYPFSDKFEAVLYSKVISTAKFNQELNTLNQEIELIKSRYVND